MKAYNYLYLLGGLLVPCKPLNDPPGQLHELVSGHHQLCSLGFCLLILAKETYRLKQDQFMHTNVKEKMELFCACSFPQQNIGLDVMKETSLQQIQVPLAFHCQTPSSQRSNPFGNHHNHELAF